MSIKNLESYVLAASYFRPFGLSSPQLRLTAVFGMGTGVAIAPNHQNAGFKKKWLVTTSHISQIIVTNHVGNACFDPQNMDRRIAK